MTTDSLEGYFEQLYELEKNSGMRASWNVLPNSRVEAARLAVPLGVLYTPLKKIERLKRLNYQPVMCKRCNAILNPTFSIDFNSKRFHCSLCRTDGVLPVNYHDISADNLPAEVCSEDSTIEYNLSAANPGQESLPAIYLFLVDLCVRENEFEELKDSLLWILNVLDTSNSYVGLITVGTTVQLYDLTSPSPKSYIFRGNRDISGELDGLLGLRNRAPNPGRQGIGDNQPFLVRLEDYMMILPDLIMGLSLDPWEVKPKNRPIRATGAALGIAQGLLAACYPNVGARVVCFAGGPCTVGPGQIAGISLKEGIRSHSNIKNKDNSSRFVRAASKYYKNLAHSFVEKGHVVDLFGCSLDQVGAAEMLSLVDLTGGIFVQGSAFNDSVFKRSLKRLFASTEDRKNGLVFGMNATVEINCSADLKIIGMLGPGASLNQHGSNVGDRQIGKSLTNSWKLCSIDNQMTLAIFLDVSSASRPDMMPGQSHRYLQVVTRYQSLEGEQILRVSSRAFPFVGKSQINQIAGGFDQEAAAVLCARIAASEAETEDDYLEVTRRVDKKIIQLAEKFSDYRLNVPESFSMLPNFQLFPQFMYHFRRSPFVKVFGNSPDETAYYRYMLASQTTMDCLTMIQPTLMKYELNSEEEEGVSADSKSVLLLDTFFHVVVWVGEEVAAWRDGGYADKPEFVNVKNLLNLPYKDAEVTVDERFPIPRYTDTDQYKSQARFVLAKMNPTTTYRNDQGAASSGEVIVTDDVSLQSFLDYLKKLVVSKSKN